jgi:hypothetical protein
LAIASRAYFDWIATLKAIVEENPFAAFWNPSLTTVRTSGFVAENSVYHCGFALIAIHDCTSVSRLVSRVVFAEASTIHRFEMAAAHVLTVHNPSLIRIIKSVVELAVAEFIVRLARH